MATTIVEQYKISPPSDAATEFCLPIVSFDMAMYGLAAEQRLFFFDFPSCSKSHFFETIVPQLKHSLSLTLSHFLPLAGNIIHPLNPGDKPTIRYVAGDFVSFTVSESNSSFIHLSGHHPRDSDEFYAFVPHLPPAIHTYEHSIACPILALQATIFPGQGVCIGFVMHHVTADASTMASFMQAWAIIYSSTMHNNNGRLHDDEDIGTRLREAKCLPFYDRETVVDINGLRSKYWDDLIVKYSLSVEPPQVKFPTGKVRATFVLTKDEIQKLKNFVLAKRTGFKNGHHLSSFTVVCALVWICSAKSVDAVGGDQAVQQKDSVEGVGEDEPEYFIFGADCRGRLNPLLPANYFGNCAIFVHAELKHGAMKGDVNGFIMAAKSIGNAIQDCVYGEKGIMHGVEHWVEECVKLVGKRIHSVAGSPRFDLYGVDFGWGKPDKVEFVSIDWSGSMSLSKSREFEGGLEIGLSKPKLQMEAFTRVFTQLLKKLLG